MPTRKCKPQESGTPEKVIPPLGWLFLVYGITLYVFAFRVPWFGQYCIFFGNCSLVLAAGCLGYWLYIHRNEIKLVKLSNFGNLDLHVIYTSKMQEFLYQSDTTVPDSYDPRYQQFPQVSQTKDGLKIEAIGNLRQWFICDKFRDDLESFLNRKGYELSI